MPSSAMKREGTAPIIDVKRVSFRYPTAPRPSLEDVSFTLYPGDRVLVIGHNGSGKSTLLTLLAGRRMPQKGGSIAKTLAAPTATRAAAEPEVAAPGAVEEAEARTIRVMGADPFDDTSMGRHIALIGAPWPAEAFFGNTVDRVASPAPLPERKRDIASALHLRLSRWVDKMSSGEKRRVQILHGMLSPATVFLLDECSTDIDVAERKTVLALVKKECEERSGCCLYATHILDRVDDWATHLLLMKEGRVVKFLSAEEFRREAAQEGEKAGLSLEQFAVRFMASGSTSTDAAGHEGGLGGGAMSSLTPMRFDAQGFLARDTATALRPQARDSSTNASNELEETDGTLANVMPAAEERNYFATEQDRRHPHQCTEVVISCTGLTFREVFHNASFHVYRGERVLLCGCNGAGKSTLLNMLGGKQFFPNAGGALRVLGKACYDDMTLNAQVAYGGDWWTQVPGGEVHVREMLTISTPRAERLRALLAVDMDWDVRHISGGEQKRVQLLLYLLEDKPIVLLDEATADLDVDQRHALLSFLFVESVCRGVTVVYSTHIFGGLTGWADSVLILDRTVRGVHAMWRLRDGDAVDLERVAEELVALKAREEF